MQPNETRRPRARFLDVAPLLLAVIVVVAVVATLRASLAGPAGPAASPSVTASAVGTPPPVPTATAQAVATPAPATPTPIPPPLPAGLTNRTWVTRNEVEGIGYVAGTLDGRHHLVLPAGEFPLDASDGRVLSVRRGPVAASGFASSSTVIVRDVATGETVVAVDVPGDLGSGSGVLGADVAYVATGAADVPGVVSAIEAISLADGTVRDVVPAQDIGVDPIGSPPFNAPSRGPLALSPSGRTLGSCIFRNFLCDVQVVDLTKGVSRVAVRGLAGGLWLLSDEVLVTTVGEADTAAYEIATGKVLWMHAGARAESGGYIESDNTTLVQAFQDIAVAERVVATIDLRTGATRELLRVPRTEPYPDLWAGASNDRYAVLVSAGPLPAEALAGAGSLTADLLDLSTGKIERSALRVTIR